LEFDERVKQRLPLLSEALLQVGHRQTRNRGTIGGSLCHLDPAAEIVNVAAACDAVVEVAGPQGARELPFSEFPADFMTSVIGFDEIVTAIRFPLWSIQHGHAFIEFARRHGDFAIVSAAALLELRADGAISRAALALGGVGNVASPAMFREVSEICREVDALDDVHVPSGYRRRLAAVLSRRALETAYDRAAARMQ
jgi:aerobic carbon-monoxide dehydrogenase medium subunit